MAGLLERADSLLLIIDAQPAFDRPDDGGQALLPGPLDRIAWLTAVAAALDIPVVVTEEDAGRNGPTVAPILAAMPPTTLVMAKHVFGAADQPDILAEIQAVRRHTIVIVGMETDVCVAHSAIGLLDRGFRVVVVEDATSSPGSMHDAGIRRMAAAGVEISHAKGIYYEWVRSLDAARTFQREHPDLADPPGFSL